MDLPRSQSGQNAPFGADGFSLPTPSIQVDGMLLGQ